MFLVRVVLSCDKKIDIGQNDKFVDDAGILLSQAAVLQYMVAVVCLPRQSL